MKKEIRITMKKGYWVATGFLAVVLIGVVVAHTIRGPGVVPAVHRGGLPGYRLRRMGPPGPVFTPRDLESFDAFQRWLDSIRGDSSGRSYDSLVRARPGLLDSIHQVEEYFHLNHFK